jgi:hypothetical protein
VKCELRDTRLTMLRPWALGLSISWIEAFHVETLLIATAIKRRSCVHFRPEPYLT